MPISSPNAKQDVLKAFGEAVRSVRKGQGVSQEELAHRCAIDRSYLGSIERGEQNAGLLHLARIAAALDVTVTHLMDMAGL